MKKRTVHTVETARENMMTVQVLNSCAKAVPNINVKPEVVTVVISIMSAPIFASGFL